MPGRSSHATQGAAASRLVISLLIGISFLTLWFSAHAQEEPSVVINEIMWGGVEYLELRNTSDAEISLAGWELQRQRGEQEPTRIFTFGEGDTIGAGDFYLIERNEDATTIPADKVISALALLNTGELLRLLDAENTIVDQANQPSGGWFAGRTTGGGISMERKDPPGSGVEARSWHTSTGALGGRHGTPRTPNSPGNRPPSIAVTGPTSLFEGERGAFSATVTDPDGDRVTVSWDFGDGGRAQGTSVTHTYGRAGSFTITATASDGSAEAEATHAVLVRTRPLPTSVVVNETLPDPVGSDAAGEFIELFNTAAESVDLSGAKLDDAEGGSTPYTLTAGTVLQGREYRSFPRSETRLALNNNGDSARLLASDGTVVHSLIYGDVPREGAAWARKSDGSAEWTATPTPGAANVFTPLPARGQEDDEGASGTPSPSPSASPSAGRFVSLAEVRSLARGARVQVSGVVTAPPNLLGRGVFYLAESGSGLQVFVSKGDPPPLSLGDRVTVDGVTSSIRNEARVRADAAGVRKTGSGAVPASVEAKTGAVGEALEGTLVSVRGTVTKLSGNTFTLDDGSGPLRILIRETTGWKRPQLSKGQELAVVGLASQSGATYRILPRFESDLQLAGRVAASAAARSGTVGAGKVSSQSAAARSGSTDRASAPRGRTAANRANTREAGPPSLRASSPRSERKPLTPHLPVPTYVAWGSAGVLGILRLLARRT
ncbi:MAG: Endonuclease/exonuclease/phosphatase [Parcubacteria group bacterium Gr01-1014_38]|nr:MAG: Endonuclease/exonuclease/phosphatase [Parcubacteria group bacterium Gr01-1014_38]